MLTLFPAGKLGVNIWKDGEDFYILLSALLTTFTTNMSPHSNKILIQQHIRFLGQRLIMDKLLLKCKKQKQTYFTLEDN